MKNNAESLLAEFDFIVEVRSFELAADDWQNQYLRQLAEWDKYIFNDGEITRETRYGELWFGSYRFLDKSELDLSFESFAGKAPRQPCEFVARLLGFFCFSIFEFDAVSRDEAETFVIGNLKESMGAFVGRNRRAAGDVNAEKLLFLPSIALRQFDAELTKYHFEDGDALLSRDDSRYCDYVTRTIESALLAKGLFAPVFLAVSCHNPFDFGLLELAGEFYEPMVLDEHGRIVPESASEIVLRNTSFEIWAFDFSVAETVLDNCAAARFW